MENETLASASVDQLIKTIGGTRVSAKTKKRERVIASVARARDKSSDREIAQLLTEAELRPFSRRIRTQIAAAGTPSTFVDFTLPAYQPKPYPFEGATQMNDQPVDDGVLFINEIGIELPANMLRNTYEVLRNQFGVKLHYAGEKKPRVMPLADILESGGVYAVDAGNNSGTAVAGVNHQVRPPALLGLVEDEVLIVKPKESQVKLEFVRLPQFSSNPTLTAESAILYAYVTWRGERLSQNHERF